MDQKVMKLDDLNPDGLRITVNWDGMDVGSSFFVPCVNTDMGAKQLKSVAKMKSWEFNIQICIENQKLGLRVWRTL
jgi:hypothetical protein